MRVEITNFKELLGLVLFFTLDIYLIYIYNFQIININIYYRIDNHFK
jgi:hypothetical protein